MFESFKQASIMAIVCKDIWREELVFVLEKGISPGWWDKEVQKITYKIVSELIEFSSEIKDTKENCVKRALFALEDRILLKKETKIFNTKKKVDRFLKNKTNIPLQVYETFYNCKPCDVIGDQCNEVGLNEGILNIFLTTGKSNTEFSLQLTNGIVIELYRFIIIKKKVTWKIFQGLLLKISNNKNNILSGESEKNLCKKVKSLVNTKSTLITKRKSNDLKTFEKSCFLFPRPNSPSSVMFIKKELPVVLVDNDIDTDRTFNVISESILTWENSELKNELKLSRVDIQTLLSKLSVSNLEVHTLTTCLREVVSDQEIGKQTIIDLQKELSEVQFDQELCSIKLNESLQKLNSLNPKNIERTIDRRERKISELTGVNDRVVKKLNESLLNEEKLKDEIKNSSVECIAY